MSCENITQPIRGPPEVVQDYHVVEWYGYVVAAPIICGLGVLLNIINFTIFTGKKFLRSVSYLMMAALAIADGITLLFSMPLGMSRCGYCNISTYIHSRLIFEVYFYLPLTNFSENLSVWITMALCVERYISMQHYTLSKTWCTKKNVIRLLLVLVVVAAALNMPYYFLYKVHCSRRISLPLNESPAFTIFSMFRAVVVQFLPLILLIIINGLLMYSVYQAELRREAMSTQSRECRRQRAQIRLTILLISIVFLFLLGNIPVAFAYQGIYQLFFGRESVNSSHFYILRTTTHILSLMSYASNFILYCTLNNHFWSSLVAMIACKERKSGSNSVTPANKMEMTSTVGGTFSSGNDDEGSVISDATIAS